MGLACRAGKVVSGEFSTEKAIKNHTAYLCVVATDSSDNTKKHFTDMCTYRDIPIFMYGNKEEIGHAIGKEFRASLAICDEGFARQIVKLLSDRD